MKELLSIILALLLVVALTIVGPPADAVYAHDADTPRTHTQALARYSVADWGYKVYLVEAYTDYVTLTYDIACMHPCNFFNDPVTGYALHLGYGDTEQECRSSVTRRDHMTSSPTQEDWYPCYQEPEVGQIACIHWCCQPWAGMMTMKWVYAEITVP